jgi:hypothetical protein
MSMTGGQLRVLTDGHLWSEGRDRAAGMAAIRAAVWADEDGFEEMLAATAGSRGKGDARARLAAELRARERAQEGETKGE